MILPLLTLLLEEQRTGYTSSSLTSWYDQNDRTRPNGRRAVTRVFKQSFEDIFERFSDEFERRNTVLDQNLELSLKAAVEIKELNDEPTSLVLELPLDVRSETDHLLDKAFFDAEFDGRLDRRLGFYLRSILLRSEELEFQRQEALAQALQAAWKKALRRSNAA